MAFPGIALPEVPGAVRLRELRDADREAISRWRYPGELALYSPREGALALRSPDHIGLFLAEAPLIGYGTLGPEAQVPGGDYVARAPGSDAVVDVGLGLRPDLVGAGHGADALAAVAAWAVHTRAAVRLRATVAAANKRATALVEGAGFHPTHRFVRPHDARAFLQYERLAACSAR